MARGGARPGAGRRKGSLNKATACVKEAALVYSEDAVATLASIMTSDEQPAAARVAAANAILDRAHGKPKQSVEMDVDANVQSVIRRVERVIVDPSAPDA
jgi:cell division protein ZapA (FtsZ GTPase activity inhibitor)